jgi:phosphoenolpyruvate phosphomutase
MWLTLEHRQSGICYSSNVSDAKQKTVYIPMSADLIHPGHIKIISAGAKLGTVTVGLLTDEAIAQKKSRQPIMTFEDRRIVIENIKGVNYVMPQESSDYRPNLLKLKPDYVVHGDDWPKSARQQVTDIIAKWGGELMELPYAAGISSTLLRQKAKELEG